MQLNKFIKSLWYCKMFNRYVVNIIIEIHFLQYPIAYGEWMIIEQKFSIKSYLQTLEFSLSCPEI
jgi:hypothetical protein